MNHKERRPAGPIWQVAGRRATTSTSSTRAVLVTPDSTAPLVEVLSDGSLVTDETVARVGAPSWTRRYVTALAAADLGAELLATLLCWWVRPSADREGVFLLSTPVAYWLLGLVMIPLWLGALALGGAYRRRGAGQGMADYRVPVVTALRLAAVACILAFAFHATLSRLLVVLYFPALLAMALFLRLACRQVLSAFRRRGRAVRRMLLVGDAACVEKFVNHLRRSPLREYQLVGACAPAGPASSTQAMPTVPVVGRPDETATLARQLKVDTVLIVGHPPLTTTTLQEMAWRVEGSGCNLFVAPDVVELAGPRISPTSIGGLPVLHIGDPLIGERRQAFKAAYERTLALLLMVILSPVMAVVSLAILLDSGGPVFYRQRRVGFKGQEFTILKFRTMVPGADLLVTDLRDMNDHDGALFKVRQDPRVTRVGRFLRRYSLDELPQLINVVKGEMVLVGPRPCLPTEAENFSEAAKRRFLARPGLTGLWQVSGRSDLRWVEAVRLDLYYVENWSPWMDLMIAWRTLWVVATGRGGY